MDFAPFDKRHYPTLSVREGYAEWSKTYDDVMFDEIHVDLLTRIETVAWSDVSQALDLACGTGYIGAWLRRHGSVWCQVQPSRRDSARLRSRRPA